MGALSNTKSKTNRSISCADNCAKGPVTDEIYSSWENMSLFQHKAVY